jgi:hypothetical protein
MPYLQNNWTLTLRFQVSGVSSKKVRAGLKPGPPPAEHLKPILRKGFNTPDNVQKKELFSKL